MPIRLPGLNEILSAALYARWSYGKFKKQWTETCSLYMRLNKVPEFVKPISIEIHWVEPNNRRDVDNVCAGAKFICDALVMTQRIKNDTRYWIKTIAHSFGQPDKKNPRVVITLNDD